MLEPGARTSGLRRSESGVGPADEKLAIVFGGPPRVVDTAPTLMACAELAGELTDPWPSSSKLLPPDTTGTTPARAARSSARATRSRDGSISASASDMLITSMPSATAASIAATSSGELPFRPNRLGIVSAL